MCWTLQRLLKSFNEFLLGWAGQGWLMLGVAAWPCPGSRPLASTYPDIVIKLSLYRTKHCTPASLIIGAILSTLLDQPSIIQQIWVRCKTSFWPDRWHVRSMTTITPPLHKMYEILGAWARFCIRSKLFLCRGRCLCLLSNTFFNYPTRVQCPCLDWPIMADSAVFGNKLDQTHNVTNRENRGRRRKPASNAIISG